MYYNELTKGFALAIIDEIIECEECSARAADLIERFIGGKMTVEEVSLAIE